MAEIHQVLWSLAVHAAVHHDAVFTPSAIKTCDFVIDDWLVA